MDYGGTKKKNGNTTYVVREDGVDAEDSEDPWKNGCLSKMKKAEIQRAFTAHHNAPSTKQKELGEKF